MSGQLPVVAAVPNYNMGEQLEALLPQLRSQEYADVFVLDDASTDESREIVEALDLGVKFVGSTENQGAGPTRNLIIPALGFPAIIHFIDADTDLQTERMVEVAQDIMPDSPVGFIGGLALSPDGNQNVWNFGPRQSLYSDTGATIQSRIGDLLKTDPDKAATLRDRFPRLLADWPDPFSRPKARQVFWNIEQNLLMQSATFAATGGFDPKFREHEIQDLAIRMHQAGLPRYFDPSFVIQHKETEVRGYNRQLAQFKTEFAIHRRYGFRNWLRPEGSFRPEL